MKIQKLEMQAFGPFTDKSLEFNCAQGGLHIVYGPNEAGKSSSLRALKALLFGIPSRTTDNFLHDNKALRIAGLLRSHSGEELGLVRRKGNKNTLLTPAGDKLDDTVLLPFLQGVSAEVFDMLFGIDHVTLVEGGQDILEQKGEVGQALFAASMGSSSLHRVLGQLDEEADELFKARGSTQLINAELKVYNQLQKTIKEQSLSSREWGEALRRLEKTNKALGEVHDEIVTAKAERNRLQRIHRAIPKITVLDEYSLRLGALGIVVELPEDFCTRRQEAMLALEKSQERANSSSINLLGLQQKLESITVNRELLSLSETIADLHARLGGHRKALQDRPQLDVQCGLFLKDAEELLKSVRPELSLNDAEELRPVLNKSVRIAELGNQHQALTERVFQVNKALRDATSRLKLLREEREQLTEPGSAAALRIQINLVRKSGNMDEGLRTSLSEFETLEQSCEDKLARLSNLWSGSLEEPQGLPLPAQTSIDRFEQEYSVLTTRIDRLTDRQTEYTSIEQNTQKQLDEIERSGAVPTEENLLEVRAKRGRIWKLLRRQWLDGETVDAELDKQDQDNPLHEVFEAKVGDADDLADRLRREAERVQKQANLLAAMADAEKNIQQVSLGLEECSEEQKKVDTQWNHLWQASAIKPLTPREMRSWLDDMGKLQGQLETLNTYRRRASDLESSRKEYIHTLQQEIKTLGRKSVITESLEALLAECDAVATDIEVLGRERKALDENIKAEECGQSTAEIEQGEAADALEQWQSQWLEIVGSLGLGATALPVEVTGIIENIRELFSALKEAEGHRSRIDAIDTDAECFRDEVANLVTQVAKDLTALSPELAVEQLTARVTENGQQESKQQQLLDQIEEAEGDIRDAESLHQTMSDRLEALCLEAQCTERTELEPAERRSIDYQRLKSDIDGLEQELRAMGEGMPIAELVAAANDVNQDTLPAEIEELTSLIDDELDPRKTELAEVKGEQGKELGLMDGADDAAILADEAQSVLVSIRSKTEKYVRVKLAARILRDEIESYRQQHQGPLLDRASEHFAVLTQGSFSGLRADFNESDEPVLVGVRPDDERVYVEGMSSGTRDQLYLALRFASLEKYMDSAEPMPFIVDDILVHFDDERSKATLGLLAELAKKTQVIMFTHHRRLVEQAQGLDGGVSIHEL
ncbi:MAG: AAA family ATPase [Thiotrichales bacterium]|nr:AAA family ATPase [Thiotrichales bacterium]